MKIIFVAGTDTAVGKTVVTGLLARYLLEKGYRVVTQKWVQTGGAEFLNDIDIHLQFMAKKRNNFSDEISLIMPYVFKFPASPHLAAYLEKKRISKLKIKMALSRLSKSFDFVIVEGTGGLLVPLSRKILLVDLIKELDLAVLLVAANKLGVINHALLSLEALRSRDIRTLGIIFNNLSKDTHRIILKDNPKIVSRLSKEVVLGVLPWRKNPHQLQKQFSRIGRKIISRYE